MRKVAGALLATAAGLIALLSFKSHTPAAASALTAAGSGTSALTGANSSPTPDTGSGSGTGAAAGSGSASSTPAQGGSSPSTSPASGSGSGGANGSGKSGTYTGSAADTMYGPVQVSITVSGGKLKDVTVLQVPDSGRYESEIVADALPILHSEALAAQSANIDIVSGATFTSQGYAQSLQSALDKAGMK